MGLSYILLLYIHSCVYTKSVLRVSILENLQKPTKMPKGSGLTKPLKLSPELAVICDAKKGENLARPEVVKRLWAYIKKYFTPDEKMKAVFGEEKVRAFGMAKFLKEHL